MKTSTRCLSLVAFVCLTLAALLLPVESQAQFPDRAITMYCAFAPGGSMDLATRAISGAAEKILGKPVMVENKGGGGGTVALALLANAKPDGYTLCGVPNTGIIRAPQFQKVTYKPLKSFTPLVAYAIPYNGIVTKTDAPWKTFKELVDYAKKNPNKIKYGTSGLGTGQHLAMEYLAMKLGIKWDHVPFPGGAQVVTALLGGHVQVISQTTEWKEQALAGKFRLLVVPTPQRLKAFPQVPTLMEKGYDFAVRSNLAFMGPAGMPAEAVEKLDQALGEAMKSKVFLDVMDKFDMPPAYMGHKELTQFVQKDHRETGELIKSLGIGLYKKQ